MQAEGEVEREPDTEKERQEPPENLLVLGRDLPVEPQKIGGVERDPDEQAVQRQDEDEATSSPEPLRNRPSPSALHVVLPNSAIPHSAAKRTAPSPRVSQAQAGPSALHATSATAVSATDPTPIAVATFA